MYSSSELGRRLSCGWMLVWAAGLGSGVQRLAGQEEEGGREHTAAAATHQARYRVAQRLKHAMLSKREEANFSMNIFHVFKPTIQCQLAKCKFYAKVRGKIKSFTGH